MAGLVAEAEQLGRANPPRARRNRATLASVAGIAAMTCFLTVPAATTRASATTSDVAAETSLAGDGPNVVPADPFSLDAPGLAPGQIEMTTVSTRPTLVTGPEARVQVRGVQPDDSLRVTSNGTDVSDAFAPIASRPDQAGGIREGVVPKLQLGTNRFTATAVDGHYGTRTVTLTVIDHPLDGPVISGPHQAPFECSTAASGMGQPTDANCDAPTQVTWYARTNLGKFVPLSNPDGPLPKGTARTELDGRLVPFVVRVESAVINRSITRIAVLDDPGARGPGAAFQPTEWNHNLLYQFGESCGTGFKQGSNSATDVFGQITNLSTSDIAGPFLDLTGELSAGWMVAESTLTTFGVSCNPGTSAETLMMVKEHITDQYGDVNHTIGAGASGGAIQQYLVANNYPGLIDAGTPLLSFPDVLTTAMTVSDCILLNHVFTNNPQQWNIIRQDAVTGEIDPETCDGWQAEFGSDLDPNSCPGGIPKSQIYNAATNPNGVRCDLEDDDVNLLGRDASGQAILPIDNTGVQYGLDALSSGAITAQQFITLNRDIGGFDHDGKFVAARNQISPTEAALIYQSGEITGRGALAETPIIDQSIPPADLVPDLDIHQQIWPYVMQARLEATGDTDSQVIWSGAALPSTAVDVAEAWLDQLDALEASNPGVPRAQLVSESAPAAAAGQCRVGVVGVDGLCVDGLLRTENPRQAAGGPMSMDNLDCQLTPVDAANYPRSITAADLAELRRIFPSGVCDYAAAPVGFTPQSQTWLSYGDATLSNPPVVVPYPLVRSAIPGAGGSGTASSSVTVGSGPLTLAPLLNPLLGPSSTVGGITGSTKRTIRTLLDLLP
ncbi:MAG TPA: DUF6351 family protein [Acidimicrobiales bacterium]